ncbi:MAG: PAS domain S-box protein [Opitutaceae bacterium]|nr:PAS domain S-box protein [Opitutaceae bacterium]
MATREPGPDMPTGHGDLPTEGDAPPGSEAWRRLAFSRAPIAICLTELETGLFLDANDAYCRLIECSRGELIGRRATDIGIWARLADRREFVAQVRRHGTVRDREVSAVARNGRPFTVLMDADLIEVGGRECLLTSLRDVTGQRDAERARRQVEEKFLKAFRASPDAVTLTRMSDGHFIDVNEGFEAMTGFTRAETIGRTSADLNLWCDLATREQVMGMLNATGRVRDLQRPFRRKDGSLIHCSFSAEMTEIGGERCLVAVTRDLSERVRAEAALRESAERYRLVAEGSGQLIYDFDFASRRSTWTGAVERVTGYAPVEFAGVDADAWRRMIHPDDLAAALEIFQRASERRETYRARYRLRRKDGGYATLEETGFFLTDAAGEVVRMLGLIDDVTERERLAAELVQAQKMETVGRLAGGVAHDFNNLLTVILGQLALLEGETGVSTEGRAALTEAMHAADMAADLTRQLLTASRQQPLERCPLDLRDVIEGMASLLGRTLGEDVRMVARIVDNLPPVMADRGSIEQVLLNLCVNARDAMEHGGLLEVEASPVSIDEAYLRGHPKARAGAFVRISVSDTGCGITPELLPRIFEPFFTTKPVGAGTGLGLATVYAILTQHEGWIEVDSTVGRGSVFRAYVPVSPERPPEPVRERTASRDKPGAGERVLLVEDEVAVRRFVEALLVRNGFRVITAASGREAIDDWEEERARFDLLVTDVVMPERVSGPQLAAYFRDHDVQVPVIFMSGYRAGALDEVSADRGEYFIAKPFRVEEFLGVVRAALGKITPPATA